METPAEMIHLRRAVREDLEPIFRITLHSFGPYCAAQAIKERYGIGGGVRDKAEATMRSLGRNLGEVLVAEAEGRVVGYCSCIPCAEFGTWQVGANAVDPACQGRGIGTRLVAAKVRDMIDRKGCEILCVSTLEHDRPARRVYEKVGFAEVHRQVGYSAWKRGLKPPGEEAAGDPGLVVRRAGRGDAGRLRTFFGGDGVGGSCLDRSMEERFGVLCGKTWRQRRAGEAAGMLDREGTEVLVAEREGRVVAGGACAHGPGSPFGRVTFPLADSHCQTSGVRARLLARLLERLDRVDSVRVVDVGVPAVDEEAMGICRRAGFEEFSTGISFAMRSRDAVCG